MDDEWRNLLESSTNLTLSHSASRINRSLKGIEKEAQRLSSKSSRHIAANQLKDFAAQAGVDIRNQTQYISSIDSLSIHPQHVEHVQKQREAPITAKDIQLISGSMHPTNTMDLNNYLKYHHEYVISSTIQESQLLSARHFRKKYTQSLEQEWHQTKKDILSYLGCNNVICAVNNNNINVHNNHSHSNNNDNNLNVDPNNEIFEERLGEIIVHLSKYHRNICSPMIDFDESNAWRNNIFAPISKIAIIHNEQLLQQQHETDNKDNEYLCDLWQCLSSMIFETGINSEHECFLKENEYLRYYANENNNEALQRLLAVGARKYLEKIYFDFIEKEIEKNKNFAKKGGKPGKRFIICAFVRLKYQNGSVIPKEYKRIRINNEEFPLWPLVYYSFRVGDIDSAINFLQFDDCLSSAQIQKSLRNLRDKMFRFSQITSGNKDMTFILNKLCDNDFNFNLDNEIWKELDAFYKQFVIKKSQDPFEIIMYILIGKLFMGPPADLIHNVMNRQEDFLWFKLVTLYFNPSQHKPQWINIDTNGGESAWIPSLCLKDLQNELKNDIGPEHYSNRILYVKSLILSQQFEAAVQYLSHFNRFESIHVGICLLFYGLLKNNHIKQLMVTNIEHYIVSKFKLNKNEMYSHFIFYYLYIIRCEDKLVNFLCEPNKNLRQLVIGTISNESIDICNGLLYTFCGVDKFIKICKLSAQKAFENGEIEHCILLFILCGDFNSSAEICVKLLCSHITDKRSNHSKQFIVNLAKHLYSANKQISQNRNFHGLSSINDSLIIAMDSTNTTNLICGIHFAEFYDLFYEQQVDKALNIININDFIPINLNKNLNTNQYEDKVSKLHPDLQKYIGDICVAVMRLLCIQFQSFRNNKQFENSTNISKKCENIYNFFNNLEHKIKPIGAGDSAKEISNLYFQTRLD